MRPQRDRTRSLRERRFMPASLIAAAALGLLVTAGAAAPAHADMCTAGYPYPGGSVACVSQSDTLIGTCDRVQNGLYVISQYYTIYGYSYNGAWDLNGAASGCDHARAPAPIWFFRLCEPPTGCSAWRWTR